MYKIQVIDIVTMVILVIVIVVSIVLHQVIKKKLKDIEGDSEVYIVHGENDIWKKEKEE